MKEDTERDLGIENREKQRKRIERKGTFRQRQSVSEGDMNNGKQRPTKRQDAQIKTD